ncbi:DUF2147 domain-containing protein [Rhodoflexus sp.]
MKTCYLTLIIFGCLLANICTAQDIVGKWKTIDDEDGKPRSIVEIYKQGDKYFGKITEIYYRPGEVADPVCDKCTDDRKNKKVIGMVIIRNLEKKGNEFKGGDILDPNNGKIYDCKLWVDNGVLKVRGYIAFLYRTQSWYKHQ